MTSSLVERPRFSWWFLGFRRASTDPPSPFTSISRAHFAHSDLHHILADWCAPNYVAVRYKGEPVLSETAPRSAGRPRPAALASLTRSECGEQAQAHAIRQSRPQHQPAGARAVEAVLRDGPPGLQRGQ